MDATINIHANYEDFAPHVSRLGTGHEAFSLSLDGQTGFNTVFLSRQGLARLRDVLAEACEKWPVEAETAVAQ